MSKRTRVSKAAIVVAASLLGLSTVAYAADAPPAAAQGPGSREPGGVLTIGAATSATVKAVDPAKRVVTLQTADGDTIDVKCGKEVQNFDQIKVGDEVKAAAFARLVVAMGDKGGGTDATEQTVIARAPEGSKPGAFIGKTEQIVAKVGSVDAAKRTVTLTGPKGRTETIPVGSDVDLSRVKTGDEVTFRLTRGLALWIPRANGAQPAAETIKPGDEPFGIAVTGAMETATVSAVDAEDRTVTLKTAQGKERTFHLSNKAVNFDQIKVGDRVRATVAEEVLVSVGKGGAGEGESDASRMVAMTPRGGKPGMLIADTDEVKAKIEAIDPEKRTVKLTDDEGCSRTVKVSRRVDLSELKMGDEVTARITQAAAIVVEKP